MALSLPGGPDPDPARQQKFDRLAQAMAGFGGKSVEIRFGTATVTWPGASANSTATTVTHGLGRVPVTVIAGPDDSGVFRFSKLVVAAKTATTFSVEAQTGDLSSPAAATTIGLGWIAIG